MSVTPGRVAISQIDKGPVLCAYHLWLVGNPEVVQKRACGKFWGMVGNSEIVASCFVSGLTISVAVWKRIATAQKAHGRSGERGTDRLLKSERHFSIHNSAQHEETALPSLPRARAAPILSPARILLRRVCVGEWRGA